MTQHRRANRISITFWRACSLICFLCSVALCLYVSFFFWADGTQNVIRTWSMPLDVRLFPGDSNHQVLDRLVSGYDPVEPTQAKFLSPNVLAPAGLNANPQSSSIEESDQRDAYKLSGNERQALIDPGYWRDDYSDSDLQLTDNLVKKVELKPAQASQQMADIQGWFKMHVKHRDQISIWTPTDEVTTHEQLVTGGQNIRHGKPEKNRTQANGIKSRVLTITKDSVPGLFLHSNWHWTLTRQGEFDPTIYSPPPEELPRQRLPKAIVIGAGLCGTRALLEYLNMHPFIVAETREMNFFSESGNLAKGLTWYRAAMPLSFSNQITIEKSPAYFFSPRAPAEIHRMDPAVKLILVVKDPVERILTQGGKLDDPSLHERLYLRGSGSDVYIKNDSRTIQCGIYAMFLRRWLHFFPLEQIHILEGRDLVTQPAEGIRRLETFLGVPMRLTQSNFVYNATKGFFCLRPVYNSRKVRCLDENKGVKHPIMRPWIRKSLYDFYRPYNEEFFSLIGRAFDWDG